MHKLKDLQQFPTIFTFKIIGDNKDYFIDGCNAIFDLDDREVSVQTKNSSGKKYISFSITTIIHTYEELEGFYNSISKVKGVNFCV